MMVVPINKGLRFTAEDASLLFDNMNRFFLVHMEELISDMSRGPSSKEILEERPSDDAATHALEISQYFEDFFKLRNELVAYLYNADQAHAHAFCFCCGKRTACKKEALEPGQSILCKSCENRRPFLVDMIYEILHPECGEDVRLQRLFTKEAIKELKFKNFQDFMSWIEKRKENAMTEDISKKCPLCGNEKHPDAEYCDDCEVKVDRNINDPKR